MKDKLVSLLKKYVNIFLKEYSKYLNKEQLDLLNNIDYSKIIKPCDFIFPVGIIYYNQIYISDNIVNIPYKTPYGNNMWINNKNYSSYIKFLNKYGCDTYEYYANQLMFLLFKLVIGNESGLINGFINAEVNYLSHKYRFKYVNLYHREETISDKVINIIGRENIRKVMFMDLPSAFKFLNDYLGYHYASFYIDILKIVDNEYQKLDLANYNSNNGVMRYAQDYDHLLYGDAYNYLLDFNINSKEL